MSEMCPCGRPLHYSDPINEARVKFLVEDKGPTIPVKTPDGEWEVPRHYIALHGILGSDLPKIAVRYGFRKLASQDDGTPLVPWDIWCEGYRATGEHGRAHLMRERVFAPTFRAACEKAFRGNKYFDGERLAYWGCNLFDNEEDARKRYG